MAFVRSAKGITISDALSQIQKKLSRQIFLGHCWVFIFGEKMAEAGITDMIDFFSRHPETRNRAQLFVSKGEAFRLLQLVPPLERHAPDVLRDLAKQNVGPSVTLVDVTQMMRGEAKTVIMPMMAILPLQGDTKKNETVPYFVGSAIFDHGKMVGQLSSKITRGVMWLRNEISRSTVTVKVQGVKGYISVAPIREKAELEPRIENGKWTMKIKIEAVGNVLENGTNLDLSSRKWIAAVQRAMREEVENRIKMSLEVLQKKMNVDVVGFARRFNQKYPDEFAKVKDNWKEMFPEIELDLEVKSFIRRAGMTGEPSGLPETEVDE